MYSFVAKLGCAADHSYSTLCTVGVCKTVLDDIFRNYDDCEARIPPTVRVLVSPFRTIVDTTCGQPDLPLPILHKLFFNDTSEEDERLQHRLDDFREMSLPKRRTSEVGSKKLLELLKELRAESSTDHEQEESGDSVVTEEGRRLQLQIAKEIGDHLAHTAQRDREAEHASMRRKRARQLLKLLR